MKNPNWTKILLTTNLIVTKVGTIDFFFKLIISFQN